MTAMSTVVAKLVVQALGPFQNTPSPPFSWPEGFVIWVYSLKDDWWQRTKGRSKIVGGTLRMGEWFVFALSVLTLWGRPVALSVRKVGVQARSMGGCYHCPSGAVTVHPATLLGHP